MTPPAGQPAGQEPPPATRGRLWLRRLGGCLGLLLCGLGLGVAALAAALEREPLDPGYSGPRPLPDEVQERFAYPEQGTPPLAIAEFQHERRWGIESRWVQVPVTTPGDSSPHKVQIIYFQARGAGPRPAVLISPISGGDYQLSQALATCFARSGLHAGVVLRAEQLLRADAPEARLEQVLRTAVIDRRRAIDWLGAQDEVQAGQIGALGISLGGLVTALLTAVEDRVQASCLIMAGGDLPSLICTSAEPKVARYARERAQLLACEPAALQRRIQEALPSEPLLLAPAVDARRVLLVATRRDRSVPFANQEALYQALGRPERITLPTGHLSAALYAPWLWREVLAFFQERLQPPQAPGPGC